MYVHALHTVHAVPDLRIAGGRLGDVFTNIRVPSLTRQDRDSMYKHPERGMVFLWLDKMTTYGQVANYGHRKTLPSHR